MDGKLLGTTDTRRRRRTYVKVGELSTEEAERRRAYYREKMRQRRAANPPTPESRAARNERDREARRTDLRRIVRKRYRELRRWWDGLHRRDRYRSRGRLGLRYHMHLQQQDAYDVWFDSLDDSRYIEAESLHRNDGAHQQAETIRDAHA